MRTAPVNIPANEVRRSRRCLSKPSRICLGGGDMRLFPRFASRRCWLSMWGAVRFCDMNVSLPPAFPQPFRGWQSDCNAWEPSALAQVDSESRDGVGLGNWNSKTRRWNKASYLRHSAFGDKDHIPRLKVQVFAKILLTEHLLDIYNSSFHPVLRNTPEQENLGVPC